MDGVFIISLFFSLLIAGMLIFTLIPVVKSASEEYNHLQSDCNRKYLKEVKFSLGVAIALFVATLILGIVGVFRG